MSAISEFINAERIKHRQFRLLKDYDQTEGPKQWTALFQYLCNEVKDQHIEDIPFYSNESELISFGAMHVRFQLLTFSETGQVNVYPLTFITYNPAANPSVKIFDRWEMKVAQLPGGKWGWGRDSRALSAETLGLEIIKHLVSLWFRAKAEEAPSL